MRHQPKVVELQLRSDADGSEYEVSEVQPQHQSASPHLIQRKRSQTADDLGNGQGNCKVACSLDVFRHRKTRVAEVGAKIFLVVDVFDGYSAKPKALTWRQSNVVELTLTLRFLRLI